MQIDQYESQFLSALKELYKYQAQSLGSLVLLTDKSQQEAEELKEAVQRLIPKQETDQKWTVLHGESYDSVREVLEHLEHAEADLIITHRNIKTRDEDLVYGLSCYVDALTQVCSSPILLLPNKTIEELKSSLKSTSEVMVETNALTGDSNLINWGVTFANPSGALFLTHIEDDLVFKYYMEAISHIPELPTALAEKTIQAELLKRPNDFVGSARKVLAELFPEMSVEGIVKLGHRLSDYQAMLDKHQIDLLIVNTKVEGQLAMSGLSYSIAVEFKQIPLLLL